MEASSITRRALAHMSVRKWAWWRLPWPLRLYVGAAPVAMVVLIGYAIPRTTWYASDLRGQRPPRPPGGDKALRAVSDALRTHLRAYDLAGRFGGEEFVILLPHTHQANALTIAERLRGRIADMSIPIDDDDDSGPSVRLTVSIGVTVLDNDSRELTDLLADADTALYYAKENGRNKTHAVITTSGPRVHMAQILPAAFSAPGSPDR